MEGRKHSIEWLCTSWVFDFVFVSMKRVLGADSSGWWLSNSVEILRASGLSDPKGSRGL